MIQAEYFEQSVNAEPQQRLDDYVGHIVICPNNSLSWRAARWFLISITSISACIAIGFLLQGFWMILPFSILEMSALFFCFHHLSKRNHTQEVVRFAPDKVVVEVGREQPELRLEWQRFFTKILVQAPRHPWYPGRVALRNGDQEVQIGEFLTARERRTLITSLRKMVRHADACTLPAGRFSQPL